MFSEDSQKQQN